MNVRPLIAAAALVAVVLGTTGCIGLYNNSKRFMMTPKEGSTELDLLRTYGKPAFSGFAEDQKVYVYEVRDNKYILIVGVYEGYDLIVTCEGGVVRDVRRLDRPESLAILSPLPWAEAK